MKRMTASFILGFLVHILLLELYYINHMRHMDACEPTRKEDGSLDVDVGDCLEKVDNEVPSYIVSLRLYRFLTYKNISVK